MICAASVPAVDTLAGTAVPPRNRAASRTGLTAADTAALPPDASGIRRARGPYPFPLRVVVFGPAEAQIDSLLAPSPSIVIQAELPLTSLAVRDLVMLGPDVAVVDLRDVARADIVRQLRRIHGASARTRIVALVPDTSAAQDALRGGACACLRAEDGRVAATQAVHAAASEGWRQNGSALAVRSMTASVGKAE